MTPANTPPAVCPECGDALIRNAHTGLYVCDDETCEGFGVPVTPTDKGADEGRGTEQICPRCGPPSACDCNEPQWEAPQQGGGEEDEIARQFHEAYERLAPSFGYETRRESAVPWEQVPEANRRLMVAVVSEVTASLRTALAESQRREQEAESMATGFQQRAQEYYDQATRAEATVARLTGEMEEAKDAARIWARRFEVAETRADHAYAAQASAEATLTALREKLEQMPGVDIQGTLYIREDRVREGLATLTPSDTGSQTE